MKTQPSAQTVLDVAAADVPSEARALEIVLNTLPVGISWATIADQKIIFMNRKFTEIFGYKLGDVNTIAEWIALYPFAEDQELAWDKWGAFLAAPGECEFTIDPIELRIPSKNGDLKTILHSGVILPDAGWALATFVDITERKRDELRLQEAERQARESQAIHRLLLDHSPGMTILSPLDGSGLYVSPGVLEITGYTPQEYLAMPRSARMHPDDDQVLKGMIDRLMAGTISQTFRCRALRKEGGYRWVESTLTGYVDSDSQRIAGYVAVVRDIDELKKREDSFATEYQHLSEAASLDDLTGIANRRTFNQTLDAVMRAANESRELSLLLLDVDCFKQFNDRYGHVPGDECLRHVALAIKQELHRDTDLAARFGGDEFVALLPVTGAAAASLIAYRIVESVARLAIPHSGNSYGIVTVSIGVACWPAGVPLEQTRLLELADRALYSAKDRGRNTHHILRCKDWLNEAVPGA